MKVKRWEGRERDRQMKNTQPIGIYSEGNCSGEVLTSGNP